MKVLLVLEDWRLDEHLVKPIVEKMLERLGKSNANVRVCKDPMIGGVEQALDAQILREIFARYSMVDLILLVIDRDGNTARVDRLRRVEKLAQDGQPPRPLRATNAWEEVEAWALAGCEDLQKVLGKGWPAVRAERHVKETSFEPYVQRKGWQHFPGKGRKPLGKQAASNYERLLKLCKEDLADLQGRVAEAIA
jgi:hypothetical protein